MNSRVLYIGNQRVDLPDNVSFNLVWQIADPGELKIYGSGSSTIKLPFTPTNDSVFGNCKHLTIVGGREFETFYDCRYYERGMLMIDGGKAYITSISDGYEICMTWGNGDLVQKLKDTTLYDKSIGAFKWDESELYPLAETSARPDVYPAFTKSGNTLNMRLAMNRPLVNYTNVLAVAGIDQETIPENLYNYIKNMFLQVNGTQAIGYYTDAYTVENLDAMVEANISNNDEIYTVLGSRIGLMGIANAGVFNITMAVEYLSESGYNIQKKTGDKTDYFKSFCIFITETDYGNTLSVGRRGFMQNVFANENGDGYEPTYLATDNDTLTQTEVHPVALGYVGSAGKALTLVSCGTDDFGSDLVSLSKKTYYIYICPRRTLYKNNTGYMEPDNKTPIYQRDFTGGVGVESTITVIETTVKDSATKIESPDDAILKTQPPDKITMLGYSTAAEIVQDFIKMFPMMCQPDRTPGKERLIYFGFDEVIGNIRNSYDWSPYFVRLNKTNIGNDNVGLKNNVRFASYGDYIGFRADGQFRTFSLREAEKDYSTLSKIANFDYLQQLTFRSLYNIPITANIGKYSLAKVNEKDGAYSAGGIENVPSVLFCFNINNLANAKTENGSFLNVLYTTNPGLTTFNYIINDKSDTVEWKNFIKIVNRQKTVTVTLNINPGELIGFDFRRPVYLKQLSVYVFAKKITYTGGGVAELQGIVLPPTANGTPQPVPETLFDSDNNYLIDSVDTYMVQS